MNNDMESLMKNSSETKKNTYVEKIEELNSEFTGKSLFPVGKIQGISYSDLGKTLSINVNGDVPTNFSSAEIVIVHPDSDKAGWIGKGQIGFVLQGEGVDISRIPLPEQTIVLIKKIYQKYTDKAPDLRFDTQYGDDASKFTLGLYKNIVSGK